MSAKYHTGVDIVMIVMSTMLVIGGSLNEKIHDAAASFEMKDDKLVKSSAMLGMDVEGADKFSHILAILGAAGAGMFGLSAMYKRDQASPKAPGVFTAVFGFAVSLGLILSGVVSMGMFKQIKSFDSDKDEKKAKMARDASTAFLALGGLALVWSVVRVSMKKAGYQGTLRRFSGGGNATSTFFTY